MLTILRAKHYSLLWTHSFDWFNDFSKWNRWNKQLVIVSCHHLKIYIWNLIAKFATEIIVNWNYTSTDQHQDTRKIHGTTHVDKKHSLRLIVFIIFWLCTHFNRHKIFNICYRSSWPLVIVSIIRRWFANVMFKKIKIVLLMSVRCELVTRKCTKIEVDWMNGGEQIEIEGFSELISCLIGPHFKITS